MSYICSPIPSFHLLHSPLARQSSSSINRRSRDPCCLLPNEYMLMYLGVCLSPPPLPCALAIAKPLPPYYASLSHLCRPYVSNLQPFPRLSVWIVARPARQLSHDVESKHLVSGSDQSSSLETHQDPRTHTCTPLPPNSRKTVGSERKGK